MSGGSGRPDAAGWTIVIPVKSLSGAKTRLAPELAPAERAALARAFALDTIEAAAAAGRVARVVVVSDEPVIERELREAPGVEVVPEVGPRGLSAAIAHGIALARAAAPARPAETSQMVGTTRHPGLLDARRAGTEAARPEPARTFETSEMHGGTDHPGLLADPGRGTSPLTAGQAGGVAVLLGDLPSIRPRDLDAALEAAARHPLAFVPDAEGTGTTLATGRRGEPLVAHFGADSAARHAAAGFADLVSLHPAAIAPGLRRDVDTAAELREAVALGTGSRTASVVRTLSAAVPAPRHPFDPSATSAGADRKAAS